MKQSLFDTGLDLRDDRASVHIKVLGWALSQPFLQVYEGVFA